MFTAAERRHLVRLVGAVAVPAMAVGVVAGVVTMPVPEPQLAQHSVTSPGVTSSPAVVATPVPVPVPVPVPNTRVVETTRVVPGPTTAEVLENADDIEVEVHGRSFNRWVATLVIDGRDLAEVLIQAGHGAPCKG